MDASEYRRRYEEELAQASARQVSFRELLDSSRPSSLEGGAMSVRPRAEGEDDDLAAAVAVLGDRNAAPELRAAAGQVISLDIESDPDVIDRLLELLGDATRPVDVRLEVLNLLQAISFRLPLFPAKRTAYLETLRSIIEDPDAGLRRRVIGILSREKDEYVQRRLMDGLQGRDRALVPAAKAIQFLGYDVHADHFPMLREIIQRPPSQAAKKEAVRLLAADPSSADLLLTILQDKQERPDVRRLAAVALQSIRPEAFEEQARRLVMDDDEDDHLRAMSVTALANFAESGALAQDRELTERVGQLREETSSRQLKQATAGFIAKQER
jgi:hypothetical protein